MVKSNKQASKDRLKAIRAAAPQPRPGKGHNSRKVHDTKGKNYDGRNR